MSTTKYAGVKNWRSPQALGLFAILLFLVIAIIWSIFAELEQVSRAPGSVIPTGRIQTIQTTDGGVVTTIRVKEGDIVTKGQLLVELDRIKIEAAVGEATAKVASLRSSMARINAELFDRPLDFPPEVREFPDFVDNQTRLYHQRRQALADQLSSLRSMLRLAQQELDMNMPLLEKGDVSQADVLRMKRAVADINAQIVNVRNKYLQDLQAEYTKTEEDVVAASEILTQRMDALKDTKIFSSTDGVVKNIRVNTIGGVLRPGDEILTIVPSGQELIVEARVSPADIAYVTVGQPASIKFDSYDSSIFGSAKGEVIFVSPDSIAEQKSSGDVVYYRAHIRIDTSTMRKRKDLADVDIQPGMTATVEIQTGKNTVWHFLTKPLTKTMSEAFREK